MEQNPQVSKRHLRRRRKSLRRQLRCHAVGIAGICLAALVLAAVVVQQPWNNWRAPVRTVSDSSPSIAAQVEALVNAAKKSAPVERRLVYPYSVVPGGAQSPEELREASARDHVVAEHYAGFDYVRARLVQMLSAKPMYVSYRIGNQVYWTRKPHLIPAGEKVITDGKIVGRARCGNQLSEAPQAAVSEQEPSEAMLNQPVGDGSALSVPANLDVRSALLPSPASGVGQPGPTGPLGGPGSGGPFPPVFPPSGVPPTGTPNPPPPGPPPPGPPPSPPPPPTPVPEPGTLVLVGSGFLAAAYAARRRKF